MKKTPKKNSIDGDHLPDSRLVELLDRCAISVKGIKTQNKKKKKDGTQQKK
jgi:hypothetical protein